MRPFDRKLYYPKGRILVLSSPNKGEQRGLTPGDRGLSPLFKTRTPARGMPPCHPERAKRAEGSRMRPRLNTRFFDSGRLKAPSAQNDMTGTKEAVPLFILRRPACRPVRCLAWLPDRPVRRPACHLAHRACHPACRLACQSFAVRWWRLPALRRCR